MAISLNPVCRPTVVSSRQLFLDKSDAKNAEQRLRKIFKAVLFRSDVAKAQSSPGHSLSEKPHDMKSHPSLG